MPQRQQARSRETTGGTSSPWAPMTACRWCYVFVIYYLPAAL